MSDVVIHHPGRDRTLRVPSALFPGRLAVKGWVLVGDEAPVGEDLNAELDRRAGIDPSVPVVPPESPDEEKARLTAQLEAASVQVDRRWGLKRLRIEATNLEVPA